MQAWLPLSQSTGGKQHGIGRLSVPAIKSLHGFLDSGATSNTTLLSNPSCSPEECRVLEERVVMPDPSSAVLVHKDLLAVVPAAATGTGNRAGQTAAPAGD